MQKASTFVIGVILVLFGMTTLILNLIMPALGISINWLQPWRVWPMFILALGSILLLLALFSIRNPAWGALFIVITSYSIHYTKLYEFPQARRVHAPQQRTWSLRPVRSGTPEPAPVSRAIP